ncbi:hypothetical protein GCM10009760_58410 [Kitasatospora kazusensis]|uniref:ATP-binding protein n=1 Tax=Kitasatospora kazusensis TaxID=407974 RepID=A0ABN3AA34_9ACTN
MAIPLDISQAFRFPDEVAQLVAAVVAAGGDDESSWIEWKERLELARDEQFQHLPHTVLGFANRDPATAAQWAQGYGYLIVGAEPSLCPGITPMDPGDLSEKLRGYIGDRIGWHPQYVDLEGVKVLVIAVDPPRPGDPLHTLRKPLRNFRPGVLFTRLPGQTVQASPDHVEMLERRLLTGANGLDVTVATEGEQILEHAADGEAIIKRWGTEQLKDRIRPLEQSSPPSEAKGASPFAPHVAGVLAQIGPLIAERRSTEAYTVEVGNYVSACQQVMGKRLKQLHADHPANQLRLTLTNNTDRPFAAVQVTVQVRGAWHIDPGAYDWAPLPEEPAPWGTNTALTTPYINLSVPYPTGPASLAPLRRPVGAQVQQAERDVIITYPPLDLRPHARHQLPIITLAAASQPELGQSVSVTWKSTSTNVNGQCHGSIDLARRESTLDLTRITAASPRRSQP